jgi:transcriptional regulator with XRE-family HTH domain
VLLQLLQLLQLLNSPPLFFLKLLVQSECLFKESTNLIPGPMGVAWKERREREKVEILMRFRSFAERSKWKKARLSRELGVSISTVERWLDGQQNILLASVLAIRQFLEDWESSAEISEGSGQFYTPKQLPGSARSFNPRESPKAIRFGRTVSRG